MSQMKPYCFKCGAELDPDAIYCPECGRLQRSMLVRAVDPKAPPVPKPPRSTSPTPAPPPVAFYSKPQPPVEPQPRTDPVPPPTELEPQAPVEPEPPAGQLDEQAEPAVPDWQGWHAPGQREPPPEPTADSIYAQPKVQPYRETPRAEAAYAPAEPIYSSAAQVPAGTYGTPPPSGPYGPTPSSHYGLSTYKPDASEERPSSSRPLRVVAVVVAILLGLFLVGFGIGRLLGAAGGSSSPSAATRQNTQSSTAQSAEPAATSAPTPTPQAPASSAKFVRVSAAIPGRCTIANGCPVTGTFRNDGQSGSGSVTFNLTDQGGTTIYGTCTTQLPETAAGQTATASCSANGNALGQLFRSNPGATVYLEVKVNSS